MPASITHLTQTVAWCINQALEVNGEKWENHPERRTEWVNKYLTTALELLGEPTKENDRPC